MIAELQRRKLNMFKWREGMLSPRALFRGNPARVKFAAENSWLAAISRIAGQACKDHSAPHPVPLLDAPH